MTLDNKEVKIISNLLNPLYCSPYSYENLSRLSNLVIIFPYSSTILYINPLSAHLKSVEFLSSERERKEILRFYESDNFLNRDKMCLNFFEICVEAPMNSHSKVIMQRSRRSM